MITHKQAAHQSAEMGHEQEQQEPASIRYAQTTTGTNLQAKTPSLSLTSMHVGVFSIEEQKQLCKESRASSAECRIHLQEVLKAVQGMVRRCCVSDPLPCALGAEQDGRALPSVLL